MKRVIIVCEGKTEESFVKIFIPRTLSKRDVCRATHHTNITSRKRGCLNKQRVLHFLRNTLREQNNTYVSTIFDLYSLLKDFLGTKGISAPTDPLERAKEIDKAFREDVLREGECQPERFFPHIQPHEFEALLFSDPNSFVRVEPE